MKHYRIADLFISIEDYGEALKGKMESYAIDPIDPEEHLVITMVADREKIRASAEKYPHLTLDEWEYIHSGFAFAYRLLDFAGFCLHSSAVALENRAILFSGPCGTGKSTHAGLWQQYFGSDRAVIINDDKPALRLLEGTFYVYGTPWSGKSDLHANLKVPLGAIVFLKQARENQIRCLDNKEAIKMLIYQSLRPNSSLTRMDNLLTLIEVLLQKITVYQLDCNISPEAVVLGYNTIYNEAI